MLRPFLSENACFFDILAKIMQSAYLCVSICVKHKELPFLAVLTGFLILGKIQDGDHYHTSSC